jgi:undecaprenyl-diphosphatase
VLNSFDLAILRFFNQFAQHSWTFDNTIVFICYSELFKGGAVIPLLWWTWFTGGGDQQRRRQIVLMTLLAGLVSLAVARALAIMVPYRPRPAQLLELGFLTPLGVNALRLKGWNAFPSDHASLFVTLAIGLVLISRRLGLAVLAYVIVVICLPRIYVGLHYPTDLIAGALLGTATILLVNQFAWVKKLINDHIMPWVERNPPAFYAAFFIVTHQFTTLFQEVRFLGNFVIEMVEAFGRTLSHRM